MRRVKQIDESKRMVGEALVRLAENHELDAITISEIAAEAKVSRNTVYRNFRDKEDILVFVVRSFLEKLREKAASLENPRPRDVLLWRFRILKKAPQLRSFLSDVRRVYLMREFREAVGDLFKLPGIPLDSYDFEFYVGGIDAVTVRWIETGMKESPEEMVELIAKRVRPKG